MALLPSYRSMAIKVSVFTAAMLLVAAGLVVVFGDFRFGPQNTYHATFTHCSGIIQRLMCNSGLWQKHCC